MSKKTGAAPVVVTVWAAGSVTVFADNTSISADTAINGGSGAFTSLDGPVVVESDTQVGIPVGSMVLNAPAGFEFDTTAKVTVTTESGNATKVALINTTPDTTGQDTTKDVEATATSITIYVTQESQANNLTRFTWSGIKVRPTNGTLATGNITYSGTSAGLAQGTVMGTLAVVAGQVDAAHSTLSPATATKPADGTSTQVVTVQARDKFNNNLTTGGASVAFSATAGSMGPTTDNGNGTYTATWTAPASVGSGTATVTATLEGTAVGTAVSAASTVITLTALTDTTKPVVTAFDVAATATSTVVAINTFTATDNVLVTGYLVTESATAPAAAAVNLATAPSSYTVTAALPQGVATPVTLYGWARDAAGNVSNALSDSVTITLYDIYPGTSVPFTRSNVGLTFTTVNTAGNVTTQSLSGLTPPAGYSIPAGVSYEISTDASYSGIVTVCLGYTDGISSNESGLKLFHRVGTTWVNITGSVDAANNKVCGTTSGFSPFTIAVPVSTGGATRVPVMDGWWLLPAALAGAGLLYRRRRS